MLARQKKVCTKTFHGAGLVVPIDDNEVGYRELPESDGEEDIQSTNFKTCTPFAHSLFDELSAITHISLNHIS